MWHAPHNIFIINPNIIYGECDGRLNTPHPHNKILKDIVSTNLTNLHRTHSIITTPNTCNNDTYTKLIHQKENNRMVIIAKLKHQKKEKMKDERADSCTPRRRGGGEFSCCWQSRQNWNDCVLQL